MRISPEHPNRKQYHNQYQYQCPATTTKMIIVVESLTKTFIGFQTFPTQAMPSRGHSTQQLRMREEEEEKDPWQYHSHHRHPNHHHHRHYLARVIESAKSFCSLCLACCYHSRRGRLRQPYHPPPHSSFPWFPYRVCFRYPWKLLLFLPLLRT